MFRQVRPSSQGSRLGVLKLHSHVVGTVALLQVSALSKHWLALRHEQAGCPMNTVRFKQSLPASHGINELSALKLHWQVDGDKVLLQVSELLPRQSDASKQEQAGWSGCSVVFKQALRSAQGAKFSSTLLLHSQVGGVEVALQVSAVSPTQSVVSKHEQAGCRG